MPRMKPDYLEAQFNLGHLLATSGRAREAIPHLQQVVRLSPNDIETAVTLSLAYAAANQPEDAISAGEHAGELAQSAGQIEQAKRIESWLAAYRQKTGSKTATNANQLIPMR